MASKYDEPCPSCRIMVHPTAMDGHVAECWPARMATLEADLVERERRHRADVSDFENCAHELELSDAAAEKAEGRVAALETERTEFAVLAARCFENGPCHCCGSLEGTPCRTLVLVQAIDTATQERTETDGK